MYYDIGEVKIRYEFKIRNYLLWEVSSYGFVSRELLGKLVRFK